MLGGSVGVAEKVPRPIKGRGVADPDLKSIQPFRTAIVSIPNLSRFNQLWLPKIDPPPRVCGAGGSARKCPDFVTVVSDARYVSRIRG